MDGIAKYAEWDSLPPRRETPRQEFSPVLRDGRTWRIVWRTSPLLLLLPFQFFRLDVAYFPVAAILISALIAGICADDETTTPPVVLALMDFPSAVTQLPVRVKYLHENLELGTDQGVVAFVDGWLVFSGLRTRFSIRLQDVEGVKRTTPGDSEYEFQGWIGNRATRCHLIPFKKLKGNGERRDNLDAEFSMAMQEWMKSPRRAKGTPLLPVVSFAPTDPFQASLKRIQKGGILSLLFLLSVGSYWAFVDWSLVRLWLVFAVVFLAGQALRDRKERKMKALVEKRIRLLTDGS